MPAIVATAGDASANSYVTEVEATAYHDARAGGGKWAAETDAAVKQRALISAARRIDQLAFKGFRTKGDQALQWPRTYADNPDAAYGADEDYATTVIPERVKRAQMELALVMLDGTLLDDTGLEGFAEVSVGPLKVTPNHNRLAGALPQHVRRELAPLLINGTRGNVRFARG